MKDVLYYYPQIKQDLTFKNKIRYINECVGDGAEGTVFSYGSNKVIKFIFDSPFSYKELQKIIKLSNKTKLIQKIFDHGTSNFCKYWYIAEKLQPIHHNYRNAIDAIFYNDQFEILNNPTDFLSKKILNNKAFKTFFDEYQKLPFKYYDLHIHNVMCNKKGNWKLIDLEGIVL